MYKIIYKLVYKIIKGAKIMEMHPPYTITNAILTLISKISIKLGKILHYHDMTAYPRLRRNNRIESIHASLAIEANSLTLGNVRDVIAGKTVVGPQREIIEVKNAYTAYGELTTLNPYSLNELLRLHRIMTSGLIKESGQLRSGEEGVFADGKCIFMTPPARLVPQLIENLFVWLQEEKESTQPLLLSSVFHYEFVFIHPFSDGNGRMARIMMNAELVSQRQSKVIIPNVFRDDYILALKKFSHQRDISTLVQVLDKMQQYAGRITCGSFEDAHDYLTLTNAYKEPDEARLIM